uniref:Dialkylresorcinol condensing enzyme n=1 Tax=Desulfacinum infernum TaxID=35837 RepID=A0A832EKW1_9BACT
MKRKVLALYYSQSGQLEAIARSFTKPLAQCPQIDLRLVALEPAVPYPFPWPLYRFFDVLPECVLMEPPAMRPFPFRASETVDLVLLFYQVWFLSPSLPVTGFLRSQEARVLANTPVITVVNARDKWVMAQEQVSRWIHHHGGHLVDHVAVVHPGSALGTLVNTLRWLWTGKKEGFWGFPDAGVPREEIRATERFGQAVRDGLLDGRIASLGSVLADLNPAPRDPHLVRQEKVAYGMFCRWARWIRKVGAQGQWRRAPMIALFVAQLAVVILLSFPIGFFLRYFVDPFRKGAVDPR